MKVKFLSVFVLFFICLGSTFSQNSDAENSRFRSRLRNYRSPLREYRRRHYRNLPPWWYKYEHEKSNFIWVTYRKSRKLLYKTYRVVMNNNLAGAKHYNIGLKIFRQGCVMVHKGGTWRKAINWALAARRRFYAALKVNGLYHKPIYNLRKFLRIEFRKDSKANQRDLARQRDNARRRLMGDGGQVRDFTIDVDNSVGEAR